MAWRYRRSKSFGPFRLTATQSGLGVSVGGPLGRISVNTRGQVRQTTRIPGLGLYNTKQIGTIGQNHHSTAQPHSYASAPAAAEIPSYPMTATLPVRPSRGRSIPATIGLILAELFIFLCLVGYAASDPTLGYIGWVALGLTAFVIGITINSGRRLKPAPSNSPLPTPTAATETPSTNSSTGEFNPLDFPGAIEVNAPDAIGPDLNIDPNAPGVVAVKVVGLVDPVKTTADLIALPTGADGLRHGAHEGLLIPSGAEWQVFCLVHSEDNPALFHGKDIPVPISVHVGRLSVRDVRTYAHLFDGHPVQVALYVEATPGLERLEVRFLNKPVSINDAIASQTAGTQPTTITSQPSPGATAASTPTTPQPLPAAGWFTDPTNDQQWRWWDGTKWTTYTAPKFTT